MDKTAINVYAGLMGLYLIRDQVERKFIQLGTIPSSEYPIVISDKSFDKNGQLLYQLSAGLMVGSEMVVNGKVRPFLSISPSKHRLRILNGCNARFLNLSIPGVSFHVIGNEVGLFEHDSFDVSSLLLGSGERADVIVDFTNAWKRGVRSLELVNTSPVQQPGPPTLPSTPGYYIMQFRLLRPRLTPKILPQTNWQRVSTLRLARLYPSLKHLITPRFQVPKHVFAKHPSILRNGWTPSPDAPSSVTRWHYLHVGLKHGQVLHMINNDTFERRVTDVLKVGSRETWHVCNVMSVAHPMHVHGVHFQVRAKRSIDSRDLMRQLMNGTRTPRVRYTARLNLTTLEHANQPREMVVVEANSCSELHVIVGNFEGEFVWHCHMLEHEDRAMMRKLTIAKRVVGGGWQVWNNSLVM